MTYIATCLVTGAEPAVVMLSPPGCCSGSALPKPPSMPPASQQIKAGDSAALRIAQAWEA